MEAAICWGMGLALGLWAASRGRNWFGWALAATMTAIIASHTSYILGSGVLLALVFAASKKVNTTAADAEPSKAKDAPSINLALEPDYAETPVDKLGRPLFWSASGSRRIACYCNYLTVDYFLKAASLENGGENPYTHDIRIFATQADDNGSEYMQDLLELPSDIEIASPDRTELAMLFDVPESVLNALTDNDSQKTPGQPSPLPQVLKNVSLLQLRHYYIGAIFLRKPYPRWADDEPEIYNPWRSATMEEFLEHFDPRWCRHYREPGVRRAAMKYWSWDQFKRRFPVFFEGDGLFLGEEAGENLKSLACLIDEGRGRAAIELAQRVIKTDQHHRENLQGVTRKLQRAFSIPRHEDVDH